MEHDLAHGAETRQSGEIGPIGPAGDGHADLTHAAGHVVQTAAEEIGDAGAKDGQGQARDVLVGPEGDGQEAVDQARHAGGGEADDQGQQQPHDALGRGGMALIEEGGGQTGDAADIHDARHAQIQIAALLREDLAGGAEEDDGAEDDGRLNQRDQRIHARSPPFPRKTSL